MERKLNLGRMDDRKFQKYYTILQSFESLFRKFQLRPVAIRKSYNRKFDLSIMYFNIRYSANQCSRDLHSKQRKKEQN